MRREAGVSGGSREGRGRRRLGSAVAALAVAMAVAVPVADAQTAGTPERFRATQDQLQTARNDLEAVEARVVVAQRALEAVEDKLVSARRELAELERQLAVVRQEHRRASAATAEAEKKLAEETRRVDAAQSRLEAIRGTFEARVAATYKYGTVTYAEALVGSRSFPEFLNTYQYLRSALEHDDKLMTEVQQLIGELVARRAEVVRLRDVAAAKEAEARGALDRAARVVRRQRALAADVAADRTRRDGLLRSLEASRQAHELLVASLEKESAALAEQLRQSRWRAGAPGVGTLAWPTDGQPGSGYGWRTHPIFGSRRFHAGVDIGAPTGQPVVSAAEGLVVGAGWRGGYGLAVVVDHGGGLATLYAHLSFIDVAVGQVVARTEQVGRIGSTGNSTGPHLHYEIRVNGEPQDPMGWY